MFRTPHVQPPPETSAAANRVRDPTAPRRSGSTATATSDGHNGFIGAPQGSRGRGRVRIWARRPSHRQSMLPSSAQRHHFAWGLASPKSSATRFRCRIGRGEQYCVRRAPGVVDERRDCWPIVTSSAATLRTNQATHAASRYRKARPAWRSAARFSSMQKRRRGAARSRKNPASSAVRRMGSA